MNVTNAAVCTSSVDSFTDEEPYIVGISIEGRYPRVQVLEYSDRKEATSNITSADTMYMKVFYTLSIRCSVWEFLSRGINTAINERGCTCMYMYM